MLNCILPSLFARTRRMLHIRIIIGCEKGNQYYGMFREFLEFSLALTTQTPCLQAAYYICITPSDLELNTRCYMLEASVSWFTCVLISV